MRTPVSFMDLQKPLFMNNRNFGQKLYAHTTGAKLFFDTELKMGIIVFEGKVTLLGGVNSYDLLAPGDLEIEAPQPRGRGQRQVSPNIAPPIMAPEPAILVAHDPKPEEMPYDPEDEEAAAAHRAAVRAASASANKAPPKANTASSRLIEEARANYLATKLAEQEPTIRKKIANDGPAQNRTRGKRKAISHQELAIQIAQELKDTTGTA